jgi:hypothetical protein
MKKAKVYLSVTASLLAVAALAATKSKWTPTLPTSYKTHDGKWFPDQQFCTIIPGPGAHRCTTAFHIGAAWIVYDLYTNVNNNLNCVNPAYQSVDE